MIPNPDEIKPPSLNIDFAKLAESIAMVQQPQSSPGTQRTQENNSTDANLFTGVLKDVWKLEDGQNRKNEPEKTMESLRASRPGPIVNEMRQVKFISASLLSCNASFIPFLSPLHF